MDYSKGRYNVFEGRDPGAQRIGRIDEDEYVRDPSGELLYRLDGEEFYDMNGNLLGEIVPSGAGRAMVVSEGHMCLFVLERE